MNQFLMSYTLGLVFIVGAFAGTVDIDLQRTLIDSYRDAVDQRLEIAERDVIPNRIFDHMPAGDSE